MDSAPSFGITNGHPSSTLQESPKVLVISAKSENSLDQHIDAVLGYLEHNPHSICDLAYTLGMRRDHLSQRAFVVTGKDKVEKSLFQKSTLKSQCIPVFMFTGQAAHWPRMGQGLVSSFPTFKFTVQKLDQALKNLEDAPEWNLEGI